MSQAPDKTIRYRGSSCKGLMASLYQLLLTVLGAMGVMALAAELFGLKVSLVFLARGLCAVTIGPLAAGFAAAMIARYGFGRDPLAAGVTAIAITYPAAVAGIVWAWHACGNGPGRGG